MQHYGDFSATQGATAVPSLLKAESKPWSGDSFLCDLSQTCGSYSLYVRFLYSLEISLILTKQMHVTPIPYYS